MGGAPKTKRHIQLTNRDLDILEFCLEMKFANLEQLHQKFFSKTQSGERSKSDWWARERLSLLKRHEFLSSKRVSFCGEGYYLATELAHIALSNMRSERSFVRPLEGIDIRTFDHDRLVIDARLALEALGRAYKWRSERSLKHDSAVTSGLARMYQPDAIYWNKHGDPMAFELEITLKAQARYETKIRRYVDVMRQAEGASEGFRGVLFVTTNQSVFDMLSRLTKRHEWKFKIEKLEHLLAQLAKEREVT